MCCQKIKHWISFKTKIYTIIYQRLFHSQMADSVKIFISKITEMKELWFIFTYFSYQIRQDQKKIGGWYIFKEIHCEMQYNYLHRLYNKVMTFLDELWPRLKNLKTHEKTNKKMHFEEVFKGFRTIAIQQLPLIKTPKKSLPNKKAVCEFQGCKTIFYEQNVKGSYEATNGFFSAFYDAYMNHGQVKITPDDVWNTILQWFAAYAYRNNQKVRKMLTALEMEGKLSIKVFEELKESQMEEVYDSILLEIRKSSLQGIPEKVQCTFSTSTKFQKLFSASVVVNSVCESKKVVLELANGVFGIQKVHMGGRVEDWERVMWKLAKLADFDVDGELKRYIDGVRPILEQFVETYKGFVHLQFWNSICQEKFISEEVALTHIPLTGWLIKFFTTGQTLEQFCTSKIAVNVLINRSNTQKFKSMTLLTGSRAVSLEKNVYRPHFSIFLVTERLPLGGADKNGKAVAEEQPQPKPKLEKRENSKSMNHQNLQTRPKTSSLPKSMKMIEHTAIDFHMPHVHLREEMKMAKVNMGELFEKSIHLEMPEIHMKNKTSVFAHPYRHV